MKFEVSDTEGELAVTFELALPKDPNLENIVKGRIKTLTELLRATVRFPYFDAGTTELVIPTDWLRRYSEYIEILVLNCCDFKSIDGEFIKLNNPELQALKFVTTSAVPKGCLNMEYLRDSGFCIVGFSEDTISPHMYTLRSDSVLYRVYVFEEDGVAYTGFKEVVSLSIEPSTSNFFNHRELVDLIEQATGRSYYPKSFPNGYLTTLELFY